MKILFRALMTLLRHLILYGATLAFAIGIYVLVATFNLRPTDPISNGTSTELPSAEAAARIANAANLRRQFQALPELHTSSTLNTLAQSYASTFGVAQDALIYEYPQIQADLNAHGYYLGGNIYQLPGLVYGMSREALFEHIVTSYAEELSDPTVDDLGFAYVVGEDGTYYFSLLLADSLALSAPYADLANAGDPSQESQLNIIVNLLNQARQAEGLSTLVINQRLINAAYNHSLDQAARDEMTHQGSDNSSVVERTARQGYTNFTIGENVLVRNNLHASGAFDQWWNSPTHYHTMMLPEIDEIGIAYAISDTGGYYYTMVVGGD